MKSHVCSMINANINVTSEPNKQYFFLCLVNYIPAVQTISKYMNNSLKIQFVSNHFQVFMSQDVFPNLQCLAELMTPPTSLSLMSLHKIVMKHCMSCSHKDSECAVKLKICGTGPCKKSSFKDTLNPRLLHRPKYPTITKVINRIS